MQPTETKRPRVFAIVAASSVVVIGAGVVFFSSPEKEESVASVGPSATLPSSPDSAASLDEEAGAPARDTQCAALAPLLAIDASAVPVIVRGEDSLMHLSAQLFFGHCITTKHGAWGATFVSLTGPSDMIACDAPHILTWALIHADANGNITRLQRSYEWSACEPTAFESPQVSDLDGDGEEELVVPSRKRVGGGLDEAPFHEQGQIWTFKSGKISAYSPAKGHTFYDAADVDGDGRLDLLTHAPYTLEVGGGCASWDYAVTGPAFVRHTRADGTFSASDDVARDYARKSCGHPPASIVLDQDGGPDDIEPAYARYACALLWGRDEASLRPQLERECATSRDLYAVGYDAGVLRWCDYAHDTRICDLDASAPWSETKRPFALESAGDK